MATQTRPLDVLYDVTFAISGPRDYVREANRAANLVLEKVPEYRTYFSDLPNYPSKTLRLAPGNKIPRHLYRPYQPPQQDPSLLASKSNACAVTGPNRARYFQRPLFFRSLSERQSQPLAHAHTGRLSGPALVPALSGFNAAAQPLSAAEMAAERQQQPPFDFPYATMQSSYGMHAAAQPLSGPGGVQMRTVGIQSDFREAETQTVPYEPGFIVPEDKTAKQAFLEEKNNTDGRPEILLLRELQFGDGLPAGLMEIRRIEKLREKRAFEAGLPPVSNKAKLLLRRRLLTAWEAKEWREREAELADLQERRLQIFCAALERREAERDTRGTTRMTSTLTLKESARRGAIETIQKARLKTIRRLTVARSKVPIQPISLKRDIIAEYANFGSKVYAPLQREGRFPESHPKGAEIDPSRYLDQSKRAVMTLERTLPPGTLKVKAELPKKPRYVDCATRKTEVAMKDVEFVGRLLETAKATIGRGYGDCWPEPLGAAGAPAPGSAGALATATARALGAAQSRKQDKKLVFRPETPTVQSQSDAPEARSDTAALLLQRLIRGRAAQAAMYVAVERRKGLIRELELQETEGSRLQEALALDERVAEADGAFGQIIYEVLQLLSSEEGAAQVAQMRKEDEEKRAADLAENIRAREDAATRIQALYRGFVARREVGRTQTALQRAAEEDDPDAPHLRAQAFGGDDGRPGPEAELLDLGYAQVLQLQSFTGGDAAPPSDSASLAASLDLSSIGMAALSHYPAHRARSDSPSIPMIPASQLGLGAGHGAAGGAGGAPPSSGRPYTSLSTGAAVDFVVEELVGGNVGPSGQTSSRASPERPMTSVSMTTAVEHVMEDLLDDLRESIQADTQAPDGDVEALIEDLLRDDSLARIYAEMLAQEGLL